MNKKESVEEATIRNILNCRGVDEETIKGACDYMQEVVTGYRNGLYDALEVIEELNAGLDLQWLTAHNAINIDNVTERQFDYLTDSQAALLEKAKNTLKALIGDDAQKKEM
ncbi:MAG: hypothetical protein U0L25_02695 [Ligilactobacillus ruminis]|nr:hypothetical protein [Ligilactobacillus ruminis]